MKHRRKSIHRLKMAMLYASLVITFTSCITNEGDIGYYYGQWVLTDLTIDSEKSNIDVSNYFWKFQANIIEIQKYLDDYDIEYCIGTWESEEDILYLNFTHSDANAGSPYWQRFNPPAELGIPGREISALTVELLTGKKMVLRYIDAKGRTYVYSLKKLI